MHDPFDVRALDGSALALRTLTLPGAGMTAAIGEPEHDSLVYVGRGAGLLSIGDDAASVRAGSAGFVRAGSEAQLAATDELEAFVATVGADADLHAPMGPAELVTSLDDADAEAATSARSFQILFGPHNGSTRATLFAGFIPPGKAPWHYHLYDEIVWVPEGSGRLHLEGGTDELGAGTAFRLRPRQVHIVENAGEGEMTIIGIFTPAGSPSAAYLTADVAAEYRIAG
ncbi:MAG TPA: cupin domain-containing protein [Gaiellaceae bacterium]|nr:cupin domain-containing protein [Gaiellaceae bacterium]